MYGILTLQSGTLSGAKSVIIYDPTAASYSNTGMSFAASPNMPSIAYLFAGTAISPSVIPSGTNTNYPSLSLFGTPNADMAYSILNGDLTISGSLFYIASWAASGAG
jgi:hypothetical protein